MTNLSTIFPSANEVSSLLTAQGDLVYASSANVLARLAKGTADYKLFMNAAGTIPEWAVGTKIITITRDVSLGNASVEYSGVGFKPSLIIAFSSRGNVSGSWGSYEGEVSNGMSMSLAGNLANVPYVINCAEDETHAMWVVGSSFDSDGFTLDWVGHAGSTGTVTAHIICLR